MSTKHTVGWVWKKVKVTSATPSQLSYFKLVRYPVYFAILHYRTCTISFLRENFRTRSNKIVAGVTAPKIMLVISTYVILALVPFQVYNVVPSISAITGISPQRYVWRISIAFHLGPRLLIGSLYYNYHKQRTAHIRDENVSLLAVYFFQEFMGDTQSHTYNLSTSVNFFIFLKELTQWPNVSLSPSMKSLSLFMTVSIAKVHSLKLNTFATGGTNKYLYS